jgi:ABC-type proline/glycine betaine transport system permease subunit
VYYGEVIFFGIIFMKAHIVSWSATVMGIIAMTPVVSAHGFHAEMLEGMEHMRIHLIEDGASLVVSVLAIAAGYALYRRERSDSVERSSEKE